MQQSEVSRWMKDHPCGSCDENGVDLSLINHMLRLTPTERVRRLSRIARAIGASRKENHNIGTE